LLLGGPEMGIGIDQALAAEGMQVTRAAVLGSLMEPIGEGRFDLVIIIAARADFGIRQCHVVRRWSSVPLILLFDEPHSINRIAGLNAGADDCLSQPVWAFELVARIRRLLLRARRGSPSTPLMALRFAGWRIDPRQRTLVASSGAIPTLTAAEFDILLVLCHNPGRTMSRAQLISAIHLGIGNPGERSVDVHIRRLRSKIETDPQRPALIQTIRLCGYVFTARVTPEASD
jgi:two-component system OmpR family response regulator